MPDDTSKITFYLLGKSDTGIYGLDMKMKITEKWFDKVPSFIMSRPRSPVEHYVIDPQERITGLVDGEIKKEIPNSVYDSENETVILFPPFSTYHYYVKGTATGTYGLSIDSIECGENIVTFNATNILTAPNELHRYSINWTALSSGEEGVTIQIDADGDGVFEKTITSDNELTHDEFMLQTETTIDINPNTLNLKSKGKWITCYIELPEGYNIEDIDISTILLNDAVSAESHPTNIGDYDNDGIPDLMVKFDRQDIIDILEFGDNVAITVAGELIDEAMFEGTDYIKVK